MLHLLFAVLRVLKNISFVQRIQLFFLCAFQYFINAIFILFFTIFINFLNTIIKVLLLSVSQYEYYSNKIMPCVTYLRSLTI